MYKVCATTLVINKTYNFSQQKSEKEKIPTTDFTEVWGGCEKTRPLIGCWKGCKLVQPFWDTVCHYFPNLNLSISSDPEISFLFIYPTEICHVCTKTHF